MSATASFPTTIWDGSAANRDAPVSNIHAGPDAEDWERITAEVIATQEEVKGGLDGTNVNTVANANVVGGIPLIFAIPIADATGDTDVVFTHKIRISDIHVVKTGGAGGASDTVIVKKTTTTIAQTFDLNVSDKVVVRALTIDDAQHEIAAAGTLRVSAVKSTNCACIVYIHGYRVA